MKGYNAIAPYYDNLAGLIYGQPLFDAQVFFLDKIAAQAHILLLGGGTGWILETLLQKHPSARIWYIDASRKMTEIARKRTYDDPRIVFINGTEHDIPGEIIFDVIITHFYLDIFGEGLTDKIGKLNTSLVPGGIWLVTNFVETGKPRHRFMYRLMRTFFYWVSGYRQKKLIDWSPAFISNHFQKTGESYFYDGFIRADVWMKEV